MFEGHIMIKTGIYIRAERDGKWIPIDIGDLTEEEMNRVFKNKDNTWSFLYKVLRLWEGQLADLGILEGHNELISLESKEE